MAPKNFKWPQENAEGGQTSKISDMGTTLPSIRLKLILYLTFLELAWVVLSYGPCCKKNLILLHASYKGTDQPVYLQSDQCLYYSLSEK